MPIDEPKKAKPREPVVQEKTGPAPQDGPDPDVEEGRPQDVQKSALAPPEIVGLDAAQDRKNARMGPDAFGNMATDGVIYWMVASGTTMLEPCPAQLLDYEPQSGAWRGHRYRPIMGGVIPVAIMRFSETPKVEHFTLPKPRK